MEIPDDHGRAGALHHAMDESRIHAIPRRRGWSAHAGKSNESHPWYEGFGLDGWFKAYPESIMGSFESRQGITLQQLTDANVAKLIALFPPLSDDGLSRGTSGGARCAVM
jgi:hypothetical protein